jgi:hypothetical protein
MRLGFPVMVNQGRRVPRGGPVTKVRAAECRGADEADQFCGDQSEGEDEECLTPLVEIGVLYNRLMITTGEQ